MDLEGYHTATAFFSGAGTGEEDTPTASMAIGRKAKNFMLG
jgi:hypothetical protein